MKILIAPDSFKGTMTSSEVCRTVKAAIKEVLPSAEIASLPVADGGEGSVDAFAAALSGKARIVSVKGTDSFSPASPGLTGIASGHCLLPGNLSEHAGAA